MNDSPDREPKDEKASRALMAFRRHMFCSNASATSFGVVHAVEVVDCDFAQQPEGRGVHKSFAVSWHMIGNTGKEAHDALDVLLPYLKKQVN